MSPILCVPTMYWLLAGLCVAYAHLAEASNLTISSVPGVPPRHTPARPAVPT